MEPLTRKARLVGLLLLFPLVACTPEIVSPAHESAVDPSSDVAVAIDLGRSLDEGDTLRLALLAGVDAPPATVLDLTDHLVISGTDASLSLGIENLVAGRNTLFLSIDRGSDGSVEHTRSSTFSFEPDLDPAAADRCDPLDNGHCLLPLPNDFYSVEDAVTDTGRRVHFTQESMPANVFGDHVDPAELNRNDGFSVGHFAILQVPGIDLDNTGASPITDIERSLDPDAPIVIINADTLERHILWAELDTGSAEPSTDSLMIRPAINYDNAARYIVALRRLRDGAGEIIPAERAFQVYRDAIPTYQPLIEGRRPQMESIFDTLASAGIDRDDLYLAWDFTVISKRNMSERMLAMRDDAFANLGAAAPEFSVDEVLENSHSQLFRIVRGTYQVPLYATNDGRPGASLTRADPEDPDSLPIAVGEYTSNFSCIIPNAGVLQNGSLTANPLRPSLYGHGLLGSRREAESGHNRDFADEHGFLSCATDWIGMAEGDVPHIAAVIIRDFSNFSTLPDRMQQGFLNTLFLGRLLIHEDGFASHCAFQAVPWIPEEDDACPASGDPLIDRSDLFYDGNSQGALAGGGVTAFAQDWTRAVLGVPSMNYSTLLRRSVDFDDFAALLALTYPNRLDQQLGIGLIQMLWDRSETNGHANHLTSDTYPGTPPKKILLQVAFGDHQVANVAAEIEARTLGAHLRTPALEAGRHTDVNPYFGIPEIPAYPFDGSAFVIFDSGTPPPPVINTPPRDGQDPHETPRRDPQGKLQKSEFLKTNGAVVDTCGTGVPCLATDP